MPLRFFGPNSRQRLPLGIDFRPARQRAIDLLAAHRIELEGHEDGDADPSWRCCLPLPPGLAKFRPVPKPSSPIRKVFLSVPTFRQAVAGKEDMAAFEPPVGLAIKMVAKGGRIGHIAVAPFERLRLVPRNLIGIYVCHGKSR